MKITRHIIYLKKLCPVCQQGISLFPCYCPVCNCIIVICDEEGTIFTDINNIIEENSLDQFSLMIKKLCVLHAEKFHSLSSKI